MKSFSHFLKNSILILLLSLPFQNYSYSQQEPLTREAMMKFKALENLSITENGEWIGYTADPERGNQEAVVRSVLDTTKYVIERGKNPEFSKDGKWAAIKILPDAVEIKNEGMSKLADKVKLALLNTETGAVDTFENVSRFVFSNDSRWLAFNESGIKPVSDKDKTKDPKIAGGKVFLYSIENEAALELNDVTDFSFDSTARYFAFVRADESGKKNGLFYIDLRASFSPPKAVFEGENIYFSELSWNNQNSNLAFVSGKANEKNRPDSCSVYIWKSEAPEIDTAVTPGVVHADWYIPFKNKLKWTEDGERLFFGIKPKEEEYYPKGEVKFADSTFFSIDTILKENTVDVWHWNDPRIKPHQKKWWKRHKDRVYQCVYYPAEQTFVQLANMVVPEVEFTDNPNFTIGYNEGPYLRLQTWEGFFYDMYLVNLKDGSRKRIAEKIFEQGHLSPLGKYTAFYKDKNWHLHDNFKDTLWNMSEVIKSEFWNVDLDEPRQPGSYGLGGWTSGDSNVFIYDKYDIWRFSTDPNGNIFNQTAAQGKVSGYQFRIVKLDPDKKFFKDGDDIFLRAYNEKFKFTSLFKMTTDILGAEPLIDGNKKYTFRAKAKEADRILYSQESFEEYPDIWVTNGVFSFRRQITHLGDQLKDFKWGAAELIRWESEKGDSLDGVFIKPDGFDPEKKYPVIVFFYEKFSPLMYNFWKPQNRHLPYMPYYLGDDYCFFLPDIVYRDGHPGRSSMQCIMPGLEKLNEMGYADTSRLGIWGHSWSGYQTAYMLTQTDDFKAGIAGAPVGNMTSAYSGIRLGSGLARQFQYEKYQSRIGGTLWDSLDNYIENSPVFHAPKMNTPLLIMHGDVDDAVPWEQGVELFLALRRLDKPAILLQYRHEPHWPSKYPNKLDWAIRMKEFFDYYVLGKPAPAWITEGEEYWGD